MRMFDVSVKVRPVHVNAKRWLTVGLLALILLVGAVLRLNGLAWDQKAGYHPDERFIRMVTSSMQWPTSVAQFLDRRESPINPYYDARERRERAFAYGTLPVYLTKAAGDVLATVDKVWKDYDHIGLVGRAISAILDTLAILFVFLIGRRVFGTATGLLGAALYALTVLSIQHSHFYTTDITLNFFVVMALYFALDMVKKGNALSGFATGAAVGMALASKISAAPIVLIVPVALLLNVRERAIKAGVPYRAALNRRTVNALLAPLFAAAAGAIVFHFIFAPYSFLDFQGLLRNFREQNDILISGDADRPFTRQYYNTAPYLYYIEQMVRWSMGTPLGIVSLLGFGLFVIYAFRRTPYTAASILILTWAVPYFLITGRSYAKFLRYMLPLLPLLALGAAVFLSKCMQASRALVAARNGALWAKALRWGSVALTAFVLASTAWWALAFSSIYAAPHTANQAAQWINANVPKDAVIAMEHWEEGIAGLQGYKNPPGQIQIGSYEEDTAAKVKMYGQALSRADYIVEFSNRLYGTVPRITDRYPMARKYYEMLFNGQLGFELAYFAQAYPQALGVGVIEDTFGRPALPVPEPLRDLSIAPITINGGFADESFSAYDHPLVMVWKKTRPVTSQEIEAALAPYLPAQPWSPQLARAGNRAPVLDDAKRALDAMGGTFAALFSPDSLANQAPVLIWLLAVALFTLAGAPVMLTVGRRLPDRGFSFSPVAGLLIVGWLIWMPVSAGVLQYTRETVIAALGLALLIAAGLAWRNRSDLAAWARANWKLMGLYALLWLAAFSAFMLVRMGNPDLWHPARGGEKPMDFAYLMATIKSTSMPPYDPWFSGGYINYYYYGQFLVSVPIKLTGILPEVAYNLAIPMLFAMTLTGAFSVAYNLVAAWLRRNWDDVAGGISKRALAGGALASLMMAVLGNMDGGLRLFRRLVVIGGPGNLPEQAVSTLPFGDAIGRFVAGVGRALAEGDKALQIPTDWYWAPTRIYPGSGNIQEFPYFTFLYADLHAHLIAMPFALLVMCLALCLALWMNRKRAPAPGAGDDRSAFRADLSGWLREFSLAHVLLVGLAGMALGSLWTINSWDFPGYALLIGLTMVLGWWSGPRTAQSFAFTIACGLSVAALSYAMYLPFHQSFIQGYTGFRLHDERSPFWGFLSVFFGFLFVVVSWAIYVIAGAAKGERPRAEVPDTPTRFESTQAVPAFGPAQSDGVRRDRGRMRAVRLLARDPERLNHVLSLMAALELAPAAPVAVTAAAPEGSAEPRAEADRGTITAVAIVVGAIGLGLLLKVGLDNYGPVATASALLALVMLGIAFTRKTVAESFAAAASAAAFAMIAGVDIWALEGDIGRMNTVFKFYLQAWTLFSVAAGFCAIALLTPEHGRVGPGRYVWAGVLAFLLVIGAAYPVVASSAKIRDRWDEKQTLTLNGMQYMQTNTYVDEADFNGRRVQGNLKLSDDLAAIQWIRANVSGSPVMLEATSGPPPHPGLYRWGGRVSIYTGLPTIIGWDWHQRQQRLGTQDIQKRVNDVLAIYTAPDVAATRKLLDDYGVGYIYYGPMEKLHYPAGEAKLGGMAASGFLERVYDAQNVAIYKVKGN